MPTVSQTFGVIGQVGVQPRRVQMVVTDSLMTLTTAGYLEFAGVNVNQVQTTDIFDIIYAFDLITKVGTYGEFVPTFSSNGIITLVAVSSGSISIPVSGADGGTGISNVGKTITLGGSLDLIGAYNAFFTFTGTTNVTFPTSGTLATVGQVLTPVNQATTSITAAAGNIYFVTSSTPCTITLPTGGNFGDIVGVIGYSGGWVVDPGHLQDILILGQTATTSVTSAGVNDSIFLMFNNATSNWVAYSFDTAGFVIV